MNELKQSTLLEELIRYGKSLGEQPNASLTAERLLVAAMDLSFDTRNDPERKAICDLLNKAVPNTPEVRRRLMLGIESGQPSAIIDILYMQKKIMESKRLAREKELEQLSADFLLEAILNDPSDNLKKCLSPEEGTASAPETNPLDEAPTQAKAPANTAPDPRTALGILTDTVKSTRQRLLESVFGQDFAVSVFTTGYFQAELLGVTDKKRVRPRATFLFAGPPGVGKTFLAEKAAEVLGLPFMRFDMSEYADKEANIEFCGSDKVYKNAKAGNVTGFVEEHPKCVLLFDEIEKAHMTVIHLFLQLLDAGRLRDNFTDTEVSFSEAILIFTTNAGRQLYEGSDSGDFSGVSRKVILKALQKDINPATGAPYFPAAICSRFASGNVVMFNAMAAHHLRTIAKREVLRHAENFEREIGIGVTIDDRVYSALLFAEGGAADARTIRARAETFFDDELFELFRLLDAESGKRAAVDRIRFCVDLPEGDPALRELFEGEAMPEVLVFGSPETASLCTMQESCQIRHATTVAEAKTLLQKHDIRLVLLDPFFGCEMTDADYLNAEDIRSLSRSLFRYLKEFYRDLPIYLLEREAHRLNAEERLSFLRLGIRGVLALEETFADALEDVCRQLHQQNSMNQLARANKLVSFETAQRLSADGKTAEIHLFDFRMAVAVDPEDGKSLLSGISRPDLRFDRVIGAEEAKKELRFFVDYLKNPKKYLSTGVRAPRGVLLYGPPGTGKTLLAKAMAGESDVTFLVAEGNQFLKKYVGEGSELVHELFRTARKYAPAILFIDEIDAIGKERRGGEFGAGSEETLTAFLTEMDGFRCDPSKPVFVLAATNFEIESGGAKSLDPALVRRFDRRVCIDLPRKADRIRYLKMQFARYPAFEVSETELENLAVRSTGMSLAELELVIEMALRSAIREDGRVTDEVMEEAFETFNSGEEKKWDLSELERTARHEAGHALLCYESGETPSYLTIVARGNHGGYMQHGDHESKGSYTKAELLSRIRTALGGRAAEIVCYGEEDGLTTGASGDLANATRTAEQILCRYGMDETFGLAVVDPETIRKGELGEEVRAAVNAILKDSLAEAVTVLSQNRHRLDALVKALLEKNHLSGAEIAEILGGHEA